MCAVFLFFVFFYCIIGAITDCIFFIMPDDYGNGCDNFFLRVMLFYCRCFAVFISLFLEVLLSERIQGLLLFKLLISLCIFLVCSSLWALGMKRALSFAIKALPEMVYTVMVAFYGIFGRALAKKNVCRRPKRIQLWLLCLKLQCTCTDAFVHWMVWIKVDMRGMNENE